MSVNNIALHLIGKKYDDTLILVNDIQLSATNEIVNTQTKSGGIFNITEEIAGIVPTYSSIGKKSAVIINELKHSRRTSLVKNIKSIDNERKDKHRLAQNLAKKYNWTHIAYLDDINLDILKAIDSNTSADFCTTKNRDKYSDIMQKCTLIFDSRERKHLYENLDTDTVIILHDPNGCEAIFKGVKVIEYSSPPPMSGLSVNGAGDIFAAVFIREFITHNLKNAILTSCEITTSLLKEKTKNEKV